MPDPLPFQPKNECIHSTITDVTQSEMSSGYIVVIQSAIGKKLEKEL